MKNLFQFLLILMTFNLSAQDKNPYSIMEDNTYYNAYIQLIEKKNEFMDTKIEIRIFKLLGLFAPR